MSPLPLYLERNYRKLKRLGSRFYTDTYLVEGKRDGLLYVAKVFDATRLERHDAYAIVEAALENNRMVKEALEIRSYKKGSANVKKIYYVGQDAYAEPLIITEFVKYSLEEYKQKKVLSLNEIIKILLDTSLGLKFVFDNTDLCAHGDICPDNIYILENEKGIQAKVGDFDGASNPKFSVPPLLLHAKYKPPEDKPDCSRKYDVYSLGLILSELTISEAVAEEIKLKGPMIVDKYHRAPPEIRELIKKSVTFKDYRITLDEFIEELKNIKANIAKSGIREFPESGIDLKRELKATFEQFLMIMETCKIKKDKARAKKIKEIFPKARMIKELWKKGEKDSIKDLLDSLKKDLSQIS